MPEKEKVVAYCWKCDHREEYSSLDAEEGETVPDCESFYLETREEDRHGDPLPDDKIVEDIGMCEVTDKPCDAIFCKIVKVKDVEQPEGASDA